MRTLSAVLMCVVAVSGCGMAQSSSEALFNSKCASCHATDGKGSKTTKMHVADLTSKAVQQLNDARMYETIAKGTEHKEYPHAFLYQGMSREQIEGLVAHIRTLGKKS